MRSHWFHVKYEWQKNPLISTLCSCTFSWNFQSWTPCRKPHIANAHSFFFSSSDHLNITNWILTCWGFIFCFWKPSFRSSKYDHQHFLFKIDIIFKIDLEVEHTQEGVEDWFFLRSIWKKNRSRRSLLDFRFSNFSIIDYRIFRLFELFRFYMFSNWSTRRFVFPLRTSLRVLYLSRPCLTFSLWIRSMVVSPASSLVLDNSSLSDLSWFCKRSLRSARVRRSLTGSLMSSSSFLKSRLVSPLATSSSSSKSSFSCTWWWRGVVVAARRAWVAS